MAINVSQPFHRTSAGPIDDSLNLSKAQMLTVNDNLMPSKWFTVCADDGKFYLYDKSNEPDEVTGKFRLYQEEEMPAEDMSEVVTPLPSIKRPYEVYSTKEQRIGFWVDGKPIYQKTFSCGSMPNKTIKTIPHGISNLGFVIDYWGVLKQGNTVLWRKFAPQVQDNNAEFNLTVNIDSTNINIAGRLHDFESDYGLNCESYVTIQYTKTTDTPEPMYISIPVE